MKCKHLLTISVATMLSSGSAVYLHAQDSTAQPATTETARGQAAQKNPAPVAAASRRLTIEVTGGEKDTLVENASVYVKYFEEHKIRKDRKLELNVKTNREGVAHVPDAPPGRVLIQVVADGWKTYGRWFDVTEPNQTIKVHLEKPPKWY